MDRLIKELADNVEGKGKGRGHGRGRSEGENLLKHAEQNSQLDLSLYDAAFKRAEQANENLAETRACAHEILNGALEQLKTVENAPEEYAVVLKDFEKKNKKYRYVATVKRHDFKQENENSAIKKVLKGTSKAKGKGKALASGTAGSAVSGAGKTMVMAGAGKAAKAGKGMMAKKTMAKKAAQTAGTAGAGSILSVAAPAGLAIAGAALLVANYTSGTKQKLVVKRYVDDLENFVERVKVFDDKTRQASENLKLVLEEEKNLSTLDYLQFTEEDKVYMEKLIECSQEAAELLARAVKL